MQDIQLIVIVYGYHVCMYYIVCCSPLIFMLGVELYEYTFLYCMHVN